MSARRKLFCGAGLLAMVLTVIALVPQRAASRTAQSNTEAVPAFHKEAPTGKLPDTMDPKEFTDVVAQNAYALAAHVKKLLYQQPCYCHCDISQGHGSLLDCFASRHGSGCGTCMREGIYTYEQSRKGKTAAQIREGIERGDWQQVDMTKYQKPLATK